MKGIVGEHKWWNLDIDLILSKLQTRKSGLSGIDAHQRLEKYGLNNFGVGRESSFVKIFISQFENWLTLILVIASFISFALGEHIDSLVIISLVILSALFGFIQEYKAEKTLLKLKKYLKNRALVLRDGRLVQVDHDLIVPGDIVQLHIGDIIPADIRLLSSDDLVANESILTGESVPVEKNADLRISDDSIVSDIRNMIFMGTSVSSGNALGVVVETGKNTFFGKIAETIKKAEPKTDFQIQIADFSKFLFKVIILMTVFIFISNVALNKGLFNSFLFAVALAVGIAPEMLPAIITVTLSQGAMKMAKKKVIVKRLSAVEDFGNIDTLCMDKTGTLTEGNFTLFDYQNNDGEKEKNIILYSMLCTSGITQNMLAQTVNPTDKAIWDSVFAQSYKKSIREYNIMDENEFDYDRKRMSVLVKTENGNLLIAKGSPESIIDVSKYYYKKGKKLFLTDDFKPNLLKNIKKYEDEGFRVISLAVRKFNQSTSKKKDETDLELLGLLLFKDPIKNTAKIAVERFLSLGIKLKIISGDSLTITKSIAKEAGIAFTDNEIVTGDTLKNCTIDEFSEYAKKGVVFARVSPEQKYKIVQVLNYEGHIAGFLGDGVNDAPALREADVGISVDTGSDIAKEASDIILLQKDLLVLIDGIEAGRKTYGNIMKYILNTISANYGNMFTVAISSVFLKFIPLLPKQILLNNFISDVPLFAVATDNVDEGFMKKPNKWNLNYIKNFMIAYGFVSTFFDLCLILPMVYIFKVDVVVFQTAWFVESSISEMLVTFTIRTKLPFYKSRPSKWLLWLSVISILFVILMPVFKVSIFGFVGLSSYVWLLIIFDLVAYFTVTEIVKKSFFARFEKEN